MASILTETKKILGLAEEYTAFDLDVITHINSVFVVLNDLGVGPTDTFFIESKDDQWDAFTGGDAKWNLVKTYVYLKVRMMFDPPQTSFTIEAMNKQIAEFEWRLNVRREATDWTDPTVPAP